MEKVSVRKKFAGNILVFGQAGCGKTKFIKKIAANNFLYSLNKVECVSQIELSLTREAEIESCFDIIYLTVLSIFHIIYPEKAN